MTESSVQYGYIGNLLTGKFNTGNASEIYVTLQSGMVVSVMNFRTPNTFRATVRVGYDSEFQPNVFQVLGIWYSSATKDTDPHHTQHEWPSKDTTFVRGEQFYPCLFQPIDGTMQVQIFPGVYKTPTGWKKIDAITTVDLTSYIPATANHACYVIIALDSTGTFVVRVGADVTGYSTLTETNLPVPTAGDACVCGVALYNGQTALRKDNNNNDFVDLRFSGAGAGGTSVITVTTLGVLINGATAKTTLVDADLWAIADSAASWVVKKVTGTNLKAYLKTYFDTLYDLTASALAPAIHAATAKTTPADSDEIGYTDSAASYVLKKVTWANFKLSIKSYTDTLYAVITHYHAGSDITIGTIDGDRLPAMSATKKGGVPATGTPSGKFLKDDATWAAPTGGSGGGDVYGDASAEDGHLAVFDADGYHIKDGGVPGNGGGSGGTPISVTKKTFQQRTTLYDNTLSANGVWDISGIDQTYDHLEIIMDSRGAIPGDQNNYPYSYFNNDLTKVNYETSYQRSGETAHNIATVSAPMVGLVSGQTSSSSSDYTKTFITIVDYAKTDRFKTVKYYSSLRFSANYPESWFGTMEWLSTAAINQITLNYADANFQAGSRLQIIGIRDEEIVTDVVGDVKNGLEPVDLTSQINGVTSHFILSSTTNALLVLINGLIQNPSDVTLDDDGNGFALSFVPVVGDSLLAIRIGSIAIVPKMSAAHNIYLTSNFH